MHVGCTFGSVAIASMTESLMSDGCGEVNRIRSIPSMRATIRSRRAEVDVIKVIRVDRLSEQHHLADAFIGQAPDLSREIIRRNAALAPAHVRHHAKGAKLVASAHRGDVSANAPGMRGGNIGVGLGAIEAHINLQGRMMRAPIISGNRRYASGPATRSRYQAFSTSAARLCCAMHPSSPRRTSGRADLNRDRGSSGAEHALLGMLANGAGVEQDDIGILGTRGAAYPARRSTPVTNSESATFIWHP